MNILHLSDIHFRKSEVVSAQDPNFYLRDELIRDVAGLRAKLGDVDIIILSGDVAFAGDVDEYKYATQWLELLCAASGAKMTSIFVVPGNHDVVRAVADSAPVQSLHLEIKGTKAANLDTKISSLLLAPQSARLLYSSIDNYNSFAQQFICDLLPPNRTRATRDVPLNDRSILRIWGINTTLVSSSADIPRELYIDTASLQIVKAPGVVNLVVAHHHPSWLRQGQALEDQLGGVAELQMFGHIHLNRVQRDPGWVRLTASAVQPEKAEANWEPGYNWLVLRVEGQSTKRYLDLRAHVRVWQNGPNCFRPKMDKASDVFAHTVVLDDWSEPPPVEELPSTPGSGSVWQSTADRTMTTLREIGVRFYKLTFSQKFEIAGRLGLLESADTAQPDFERFRRVFLRASEQGKLSELTEAIEQLDRGGK